MFQSKFPRLVFRPAVLCAVALAAALAALLQPGCTKSAHLEAPPAPAPAPSYSGPAYLRDTVGSLARYRNDNVITVSNYAIVAGLNGTGHRGAPIVLRQRLLNDMRKRGVGSVKFREEFPFTPEQFLDNMSTAVVAVRGEIPPGATKGQRFDLLVTPYPGTETTSLAGGRLFRTDLAVGGANLQGAFITPMAEASGPIYNNPFDALSARQEAMDFMAKPSVVVGGGVVTEDRVTELVLHQPSWNKARTIEDRINERFPMSPDDRSDKTANAVSNLVIRIEIPRKWRDRPEMLLDLISHIYLGQAGQEVKQAHRYGEDLREDPSRVEDVTLCWKALGKSIVPALESFYHDKRQDIRLAALEAGAYHGDERVSEHLLQLAGHEEAAIRIRAAQMLADLPQSIRGGRALKQMLDDSDPRVRIAAYESMIVTERSVRPELRTVHRLGMANEAGLKFIIDVVPSQRPLVYITYHGEPRIVIFGGQSLGFTPQMTARLWDNRLMLRTPSNIAEAVVGLEVNGHVFLPVYGRGEIQPLDPRTWRTTMVDERGATATLRISSRDLRDQYEKQVNTRSGQPQAVATARLIERKRDEKTLVEHYEMELVNLAPADTPRPVTVYYQAPGEPRGRTYKIEPTVPALTFLLAHKSTATHPEPGLNLTYSEVVDALYHLCKAGEIPAPVEVDTTPLVRLIERRSEPATPEGRPESAPGTPEAPGNSPDNAPTDVSGDTPESTLGMSGRSETSAR